MRLAFIIIVAALSLAACGDASVPPTAPTPPPVAPTSEPNPPAPAPAPAPAATGALLVMVLNGGGGCIQGATVQVIVDGAVVQSGTQTKPCSYWDGADPYWALSFKDLPAVEVTVRGSAPGFVPREITATPSVWSELTAIVLHPVN